MNLSKIIVKAVRKKKIKKKKTSEAKEKERPLKGRVKVAKLDEKKKRNRKYEKVKLGMTNRKKIRGKLAKRTERKRLKKHQWKEM